MLTLTEVSAMSTDELDRRDWRIGQALNLHDPDSTAARIARLDRRLVRAEIERRRAAEVAAGAEL